MKDLKKYPESCRRNLNILMHMLSTDAETAYEMIRMTSSFMDLDISDDVVVDIILMDCGIEDAFGV